MKTYIFKIPMYNWTITIMSECELSDFDVIETTLRQKNCSDQVIQNVKKEFLKPNFNIGDTLYSDDQLEVVQIYGRLHDLRTIMRVVTHETDHMVNAIASSIGLETEGRGYLAGYIGEQLYEQGFIGDLLKLVDLNGIPATPSSEEINPTLAPDVSASDSNDN